MTTRHTTSALGEGILNELIISSKPASRERPAQLTPDGRVPTKRDPEDVGAGFDKVVDLRVGRVRGPAWVDVVACEKEGREV